MQNKERAYRKIALAISLILVLLWCILGTGASLAWFYDTTPIQKNIFQIGELDIEVSHRLDNGNYEKVTSQTSVFDDEALYEPGYTQVIFLKIENKGTVSFDYKSAIGILNYTPAINAFGQKFYLQDYLKFGVVTADTEKALEEKLKDRESARLNATEDLPINTYTANIGSLKPKQTEYIALIIYMPKEVGNIANFRGGTAPKIYLGLTFNATQKQN